MCIFRQQIDQSNRDNNRDSGHNKRKHTYMSWYVEWGSWSRRLYDSNKNIDIRTITYFGSVCCSLEEERHTDTIMGNVIVWVHLYESIEHTFRRFFPVCRLFRCFFRGKKRIFCGTRMCAYFFLSFIRLVVFSFLLQSTQSYEHCCIYSDCK